MISTWSEWKRYPRAGRVRGSDAKYGFRMSTFGRSLPGEVAYKFFGFDEQVITLHVAQLVDDVRRDSIESLKR